MRRVQRPGGGAFALILALMAVVAGVLTGGGGLWLTAAGLVVLALAAVFIPSLRDSRLGCALSAALVLTALVVALLALRPQGGTVLPPVVTPGVTIPGELAPTMVPAPQGIPTLAPVQPEPGEGVPAGCTIHVVRAGENLYRIALRYGDTVDAIVARNGVPNPDKIYVGDRFLVCPGPKGPAGRG